QKLVFESFSQADASTTRHYGGTGLGLAICSRLVSLMDGQIDLQSKLGQGSTFSFQVPLVASAEASPSRVDLNTLRGVSVLVVDDNETNRLVFSGICNSVGMRTGTATSGALALQTLRQRHRDGDPVQLLLLDAMMPGMDGFEVARRLSEDEVLRRLPVIMLTSMDADRARGQPSMESVEHLLLKPVSRLQVLEAMHAAINRTSWTDGSLAETIETASESRRILLAEDNPVNQKVAVTLLEQRGHRVIVADNGQLVLDLLDRESFDVVLMDVQMPEVDGIDATREIRRREQATGGHLPVVAMTAHAMEGDRARCLEAGMDGYLPKPFKREELFRVVESFSAGVKDDSPTALAHPIASTALEVEQETPESQASTQSVPVPVFDAELLRRNTGGSPAVVRQMIEMFRSESERQLADVAAAVEHSDATSLQESAHTLKGSIGIFGAPRCFEAAYTLEQLGRSGDVGRSQEALKKLRRELEELKNALSDHGTD
ncbi:MAG: response regulator, partial [Planctomycetota bacterium]